ncbi:hypothetical protein [Paenibacillus hexagrammi]|uniref:Uncharacterized protein n=1 Tax=Paenibacillus hexagrammi TaxID=2908839 RepID=A0ABY3SRH7_9BACL|nr:hypothetical protein [Paenibacillus sp. YPD9-1]UJF36536.1 hypothetical protein L0M14_30580 [Paenibacillus sp. YPD9-1]
MKASIDQLTLLVTKLSEDVADLKAAKASAEETAEEETEVSAGQEPQRRSTQTLVSKFQSNEGSTDVFASIDKANLSTVDSMAQKLSAIFGTK